MVSADLFDRATVALSEFDDANSYACAAAALAALLLLLFVVVLVGDADLNEYYSEDGDEHSTGSFAHYQATIGG